MYESSHAIGLTDGSDAAIRGVICRVGHHQVHLLTDGDYAPVDSVAAAQAARQAEGIAWNYPWGVTLYGILHVCDATGDKDLERFVLQHNQIVAHEYAWLSELRNKAGDTKEVREVPGKPQPGGLDVPRLAR